MESSFKLWSKNNPEAAKNINPKLGIRDWDVLIFEEKRKIFSYFTNKRWFNKSDQVLLTILNLNEGYKKESYGQGTLEHGGPHFYKSSRTTKSCCREIALKDLENIVLNENQDVVYESLSLFVDLILNNSSAHTIDKSQFDNFAADFNDIFEQFGLDVILTRNGIVFRQDKKITDDIYIPVLTYLSDTKWSPVSRDLSDAFNKFQEKSPSGYSSCITHAISALQGFLQILVHGKIRTGDLTNLIQEAQKKEMIPSDAFSTKIFKDIQSILMQKRQKSGDPHPKEEYANERSAKLVLNLIMIFIQHCITKD